MECIICGSNKQDLLYEIARMDLCADAVYELYECQACGFRRAIGPLNEDILNKIYGEGFYNSSQQSFSVIGTKAKDPLNSPVILNAQKRIAELKKLQKKPGSLLDVGAGRGYFVQIAAQSFEVDGIELSSEAVRCASQEGINLIQGDFLNYDFDGRKYDVITLWDALSSFQDPNPVISRCWDLLHPSGLLVMTLPYTSSLPARSLGKYWPLTVPPINLTYFSELSLHYLLERHGFILVRLAREGKKVSIDFIIRKLLRTLGLSKLERIVPTWARRASIAINLGDIVTVYAQKQASQ